MAQDDQMQMGNQTVDTPRLSGPIIIDKMKKGAFGLKLNLLELDILVGVGVYFLYRNWKKLKL